ncbi:MAG TPA: cytochrome d ubiquinol oxidase subunit II, partial [Janthinobacterium sp.]|nr:cytochrome d ubiquinol oxidase subunit II [Janthinobacterium sp.]
WWVFVGVLLIGFALTDGFDFGVGICLPFIGKTDSERRVMLNTIGATWEGSQAWLILAGGALFAAWPIVYATAFSSFYVAILLLLFSLFFRPVGFDYRSKLADPRWRSAWDWALFTGGFVPPLIFGIAFGNLLQGAPFHFDASMRVEFLGNLLTLLNPFALLAGALSLAMHIMHGAAFLHQKTEAAIAERARKTAIVAAVVTVALFALAGVWVATGIAGYRITSMPDVNSAFEPMLKTVVRAPGAWMDNYARWPLTMILPLAAGAGALLCALFSARRRPLPAFLASGATLAAIILTAGFAMFPFVLPSSLEPGHSLTMWDAVSSEKTLGVMFWVVMLGLPLVLAYTSWCYRVMGGKVTLKDIHDNEHTAY